METIPSQITYSTFAPFAQLPNNMRGSKSIQHTYKIVNKINNKFYYGRTININSRWNNHRQMLKRNDHFNIHLQRSWNKYGEDNFEFMIHKIFDSGNLEEDLLNAQKLEQDMIDFLYKSGIIYNRSTSSITGSLKGEDHPNYNKLPSEWMSEEGWNRTLEFHRNRDISGEKNPFFGKTHSEETRKVLSEKCANYGEDNGFYGKQHTEETKQKISEANKGKRTGSDNQFYGRTHSDETKRIIGEKNKLHKLGKKDSKETIIKKRENNSRNKKIQIDDIIYYSCSEASRNTGEDVRKINYRANSKSFLNYKYL